jgi:class 3 adenylate cyclase
VAGQDPLRAVRKCPPGGQSPCDGIGVTARFVRDPARRHGSPRDERPSGEALTRRSPSKARNVSHVTSLPSGDVTFLLTDIEGSTALFKRLGDRYEVVIGEHHSLLRDAVLACDGAEVKNLGDGFLFVFADAARAADAAVAAQMRLADHDFDGADLRVRMGLHSGDARVVDGDYVSYALHQAARISAAAHGGQIIVSPRVAESLGSALPRFSALEDRGMYRVRDFDEAIRLFELKHPTAPADLPPLRVPSAIVHNLPPQRTSFIARDGELNEIRKLFATASLVTIVGPAGVGKTRLAIQAGEELAGAYPGGVWLVNLQTVTEAHLVTAAIASALAIVDSGSRPVFERVVERLQEDPTLLVVDNCEHLIDAVADTVDKFLTACRELAIVATSREPLTIPPEHVVRLGTLDAPDVGTSAEIARRYPAVELFLQRAAQAGAVLDHGHDIDSVVRICRAVDGIPLALEIIAARVGEASPGELAEAIESKGALDASRRGGDPRQRTLRATLHWSYELLDEADRKIFRECSVFRGGIADETDLVE